MGWSIESVECLSVHGRAHENIRKSFYPGAKLIILTNDSKSPEIISKYCAKMNVNKAK